MRAVFIVLLVAIVVGAMALPVLEDDDDKPLVRIARTPQFGGLLFGGGLGYGGGYGGGYRGGYGGGYGRGYGRRYGGFGYGGGGYGSSSSEEDYG